jgi:glycosidase
LVAFVRSEKADDTAVLVGSWDGWTRPATTPWVEVPDGDITWRATARSLPPGTFQYGILVGSRLLADETQGRGAFVQSPFDPADVPYGTEVSEVVIPDCTRPALEAAAVRGAPDGIEASIRLVPAADSATLDRARVDVRLRRGAEALGAPEVRVSDDRIDVAASGLPPGKYTLEVSAADARGRTVDPLTATAFVEPEPRALGDGVLYQIFVDRFRGAEALHSPASPGDRAGGTLDGIRAAVEAGYFARLGVTTLWLSPLYTNPSGRFPGRDGHLYEAYHGYWPAAPREVDPHFGGDAALDRLVAAAHARGMRVIADAVPNHVHESHPYYREHSVRVSAANAPSWFNEEPLVCGRDVDWDETCWFDTYLPDLNWRAPPAAAQGLADLGYWATRFDLDGFRIDAVPLMPRPATRAMVRTVRDLAARGAGLDRLVVGEIYTAAGSAGRSEIRAYLGSAVDGLDAAFDFPVMWSARRVLARGEGTMEELESEIGASADAYAGSGAVMAHFLDNHDTPRFLSEAVGDAWNDPWTAPAAQPTAPEPYRRAVLGLALVFTLPGIPVLFYGDEIGLAGANDPDARRVMPDVLAGALDANASLVLSAAQRLGRLRACAPALRRGTRRVLAVGADHLVTLHEADGAEPVLAVLSRAAADLHVAVAGVPAGAWRDVLSGAVVTAREGSTDLFVGPLSAAVYVPEVSGCAP